MDYCRHYQDDIWAAAETGQPSEELVRHIEECMDCASAMQTAASATAGFQIFRNVRATHRMVAIRANAHTGPSGWGRLLFGGAAALVVLVMFACMITRMSDTVGPKKTPEEQAQVVPETRGTTRPKTVEQEPKSVDSAAVHAVIAVDKARTEASVVSVATSRKATHKKVAPYPQPDVVAAQASPGRHIVVGEDRDNLVAPEQAERMQTAPIPVPEEHYVIGVVGVDTGDPDRARYPIAQYVPNLNGPVDL